MAESNDFGVTDFNVAVAEEVRNLTARLATCRRERTSMAQWANKQEDRANELAKERETLIRIIRHLYNSHRDEAYDNFCTHVVDIQMKEYL